MFKQATEKRVAAFFADGLEECEALVVTDLLYRAGVPCDKVTVTAERTVTSSHGVGLTCDRSILDEGFDIDAYDVIFLPGGMPGTTNLGACVPLTAAIKGFAEKGKTVAAICAAPSILANLGVLDGKFATANPGFQGALSEAGAHVLQDRVVEDAPFLTSKGLGTAIDLGLALVANVLGPAEADALKEQIVY